MGTLITGRFLCEIGGKIICWDRRNYGGRKAKGSGDFYSHFGDGLTDPTRRTWENFILVLRSQMRLIIMNL